MNGAKASHLGGQMFTDWTHVAVLRHAQIASHGWDAVLTIPRRSINPGLQLMGPTVQRHVGGPCVGVAIHPTVFTRRPFHGQKSTGGEIIPQDEPPHLLILGLNAPAVLQCGRKTMTELDVGACALLMPPRQEGFVSKKRRTSNHVHLAKSLTVRNVHAIGNGRITVVPPPPIGRIGIAVDAIEQADHCFRLCARPDCSHVDDPVGSTRTVGG